MTVDTLLVTRRKASMVTFLILSIEVAKANRPNAHLTAQSGQMSLFYSLRKLSTGFIHAAFIASKSTIARDVAIAIRPESKNTPTPSSM